MQEDFLKIGIEDKDIIQNANMKEYTTLKIGGEATYLIKIRTVEILKKVLKYLKQKNQETFILGNGSNILVKDNRNKSDSIKNRIR